MKKCFLFFVLFVCSSVLFAEEEIFMFIHPGRETIVNFPSASLGNTYTVSFFLPEKAVPLSKNYPVIVMLGLVPKDDADAVGEYQKNNPAIVVGINFTEEDYAQKPTQIENFLYRELFPYLDTNYLTKTGPKNRILAVRGEAAARIALHTTAHPEIFGALALINPGEVWKQGLLPNVRTLVVGTQEELAQTQSALERGGKVYGPDFAMRYAPQGNVWFDGVDSEYLWAPVSAVAVKYVKADVSRKTISLAQKEEVALRVWAVLNNDGLFHYVPPILRVSPPFLSWKPEEGILQVVSGASAGKVKIGNVVDKPAFTVKIKLKKQ